MSQRGGTALRPSTTTITTQTPDTADSAAPIVPMDKTCRGASDEVCVVSSGGVKEVKDEMIDGRGEDGGGMNVPSEMRVGGWSSLRYVLREVKIFSGREQDEGTLQQSAF